MPEDQFDPKLLDNEDHRNAAIQHLSGSGYVIKPKEEYESSINEFISGLSSEDERVKPIVGPVVRKEREAVENLVKEFFPDASKMKYDDNKTETHLDFAKRLFSSKIQELSELSKKGVTNDQLKKDFEDYKVSKGTELKGLEKKLQEALAANLQKDTIFEVDRSIERRSGKFTNDEKVKALIPSHVNTIKAEVMAMKPEFRQKGDQKVLVLLDENGSVKINPNTGNWFTADEYIEEKLAPVMDLGRRQEGTGTGADSQKSGSSFTIPETIKSKIELDEYITKTLKLNLDDKDVLEKRNEIIKGRNLPLR